MAKFKKMKRQEAPLFCDMTWGAGGSTSELTMDLTLKMKAMGLEPNMHLTCHERRGIRTSSGIANL